MKTWKTVDELGFIRNKKYSTFWKASLRKQTGRKYSQCMYIADKRHTQNIKNFCNTPVIQTNKKKIQRVCIKGQWGKRIRLLTDFSMFPKHLHMSASQNCVFSFCSLWYNDRWLWIRDKHWMKKVWSMILIKNVKFMYK